MSTEYELKFSAQGADVLEAIFYDPKLANFMEGPWLRTTMQTTYFDTPSGALSSRRWMLRCRLENDRALVCMKLPGAAALARQEFEVPASTPDAAALAALVALGAPEELLSLAKDGLIPVCGARFTRRHCLLAVEGCRAELALDLGDLHGAISRLPLAEVELELKAGTSQSLHHLGDALCREYHLMPEPRSKFARARSME